MEEDLPVDLSHLHYPFSAGMPKTWGYTGRINRMMIERTRRIDNELKKKGYTCLVGGDMNFNFVSRGSSIINETPERREFCNATIDRLVNKFEVLKQAVGNGEKQQKIDFILKRLDQKRRSKNFNRLFQFCFMAELNRQMHDETGIIEQNFSWCSGKNNLLSDKGLKPFFDFGVPEFQLRPTDPETFLQNTYRTYHAAVTLGRKYAVYLIPSTEHIHLSVHKNGENLTTRTENFCWEKEKYHPQYLTLLSGVQHMAKNASCFLQDTPKPVMVTETKIGRSDTPTIRACKDNIEFRCDESAQNHFPTPHLALDLLVFMAGIKLGVDEIEGKNAFAKYHVSKIKNKPIAITNFFRGDGDNDPIHFRGYMSFHKKLEPYFNALAADMFRYARLGEDGKLIAHSGMVRQLNEKISKDIKEVCDFRTNAPEALKRFLESCSLESENGREDTMRLKLPADRKVGYGETSLIYKPGLEIPIHDLFTDMALACAANVAEKFRFHKLDKVIDRDSSMNKDNERWSSLPVVKDYIGAQLAKMMLAGEQYKEPRLSR